jgi:hypothetical protein
VRSADPQCFPCPNCSLSNETPKCGSADTLPRDVLIMEDTRRWLECANNSECEQCSDVVQATHRCQECGVALCRLHRTAHKRGIGTSQHTVLSCARFQEDIRIVNRPLQLACATHPTVLMDLWCKDCEEAICNICVMRDHQGHNLQLAEDEEPSSRRVLLKSIDGGKSKLTEVKASIEAIRKVATSVRSRQKTLAAEVTLAFKMIREAIDEREAAVISSLNSAADSKIRSLSAQSKAAKEIAELLDRAADKAKAVSEKSSTGAAFMQTFPALQTQLRSLSERAANLPKKPCTDAEIQFMSNSKLADALARAVRGLGGIITGVGPESTTRLGSSVGKGVLNHDEASPENSSSLGSDDIPAIHFQTNADFGIMSSTETRRVFDGFDHPRDVVCIEVRAGSDVKNAMSAEQGALLGRILLTMRLEGDRSHDAMTWRVEQHFDAFTESEAAEPPASHNSNTPRSTMTPVLCYTKVIRVADSSTSSKNHHNSNQQHQLHYK